MKTLFFLILTSTLCIASSWKLSPHLYSRGGATFNGQLSKKAISKEAFNAGAWGDESNAIRNNLTEITLNVSYGKNFKYVYGVDVDNSNRFFDKNDTKMPLNERLSYLEFYEGDFSFWFGNRAFRGDGDYLIQNWPLDEHNMLGGGIQIKEIGPVNIEFAYGIRKESDPYTRNILINKIVYPLPAGKIKTNIELHQINAENSGEKSLAWIGGAQYQRWGDRILGGSLYNIAVVNLSRGNIYGGTMQSAFNKVSKHEAATKILVKWGGDWKAKGYGLYYAVQYQDHRGDDSNEKWSFVDIYARPVYALTKNITTGFDYVMREVFTHENLTWDSWNTHEAVRAAIMLAYNLSNRMFDTPSFRIFTGRMMSEKPRNYFSGEEETKADNFIRFDYEISF